MIPYDDLVAALTSWREHQGLPVRREDLFDVDASAGPLGVADALATPFVPTAESEGEGDTGETRLATADVVSAEEASALAGLDAEDEDSTFIGQAPAWSGGEPAAAPEAGWDMAGDATGESPAAPPALEDTGDEWEPSLGDAIDAALAVDDPTPDVPPQEMDAGAEGMREDTQGDDAPGDEETFVADATAVREPPGADETADAPEAEPGPGPALADAAEADAPAEDLAPADEGTMVGDAGEAQPFQDGATAIRDPAEAAPAGIDPPPPGDAEGGDDELAVDLGDVLDSADDPGAGEESGDDDPSRP